MRGRLRLMWRRTSSIPTGLKSHPIAVPEEVEVDRHPHPWVVDEVGLPVLVALAPTRGRLGVPVGPEEDAAVRVEVPVPHREGSKDAAPAGIFAGAVTSANRWQAVRIELAAYAGRSILLEFGVAGEKKGLWG